MYKIDPKILPTGTPAFTSKQGEKDVPWGTSGGEKNPVSKAWLKEEEIGMG